MTDQEINKTIAEACRWEILKDPFIIGCACYAKDPHGEPKCGVPNYCEDLNAMHEAERMLTKEQTNEYIAVLFDSTYEATLATARQRAEAFLKTLGKWEE